MNKTISIHLQGIPFILEEQAYDQLSEYLSSLRRVLADEEGVEDILQDVELRIIELIQTQLVGGKQVVELQLIMDIISKIGQPTAFGSEEKSIHVNELNESKKPVRRFFRDSDNALLGGVCAGAAAYFNIDVVIVRAIYLITFVTFGVGGLLYFILWIIIPTAKTSSEKLQMKGQAVNLENMKSELGTAASRIKKEAKSLRNRSELGNITRKIGRILGYGIGIISLLTGTILLVTTLIFLLIQPQFIPVEIQGQHFTLHELLLLVFEKTTDQRMAIWGIGLINFSLIGICFLIGIRSFKSIPSKHLFIAFGTSLVLFIVGISSSAVAGINFAKSMASYGEIEKEVASFNGNNLTIIPQLSKSNEPKCIVMITDGEDHELGFYIRNGNIFFQGVSITYENSTDSLFHIYQMNNSQGNSHESAINNARQIKNTSMLKDSIFFLDPTFSFPKSNKLRDQKINYKITVPINGTITINGNVVYPIIDTTSTETIKHGYFSGNGAYWEW